jgi:hypothetical protein
MSKQWYYEVMGSPVGPITSAELKTCVLTRRILPETRIRLGDDGKWQTADKVKGLFDGAPPPPKPQAPAKSPSQEKVLIAPVVKSTTAAETGTAELSTLQTAELKIQIASVTPAVAAQAQVQAEEDEDVEYDFFKFVGFEIAIGHALNDALKEYCRVHHVTMTQTTRRALADFLGRKDLSGDAVAATATPTPEVFGVG